MLPIDALLPQIRAHVQPGANLVIEAAPGAGKTTRVPQALLAQTGEVIVLEPRRIAARMAARCAGPIAGYQVRFEDTTSKDTRLKFVTEGILNRRLISDPQLRGVTTVILDEFHERHLQTDLALALLRRLQKTRRPDLSIVVMSATLNAEPVADFLGKSPIVKSEGRAFPLEIEHTPYSPGPLESRAAAHIERALNTQPEGDILVFLPGAAEINRTARALAHLRDIAIAPLYGDLSPAEQDRAVSPGPQRKVVLATNLAESSITIEGVRTVIDSGLARIATDSPWTGLPSLEVKRVSKASAQQRAGRAGRTAAGRAIRLYTAEDFHRRPDHDTPELLRRELSGLCLQLEAMGIHHPDELEWLDPPPPEAIRAAEDLLDRLGARGPNAAILARLPVHPRLARLIVSGASDEACRAAALLSSGQKAKSLDDPPDDRTQAVYRQLRKLANKHDAPEGLDLALLRAFPDRVIKKPPADFALAIEPPWLVHPIQPEWLIDVFPERVRELNRTEWNRQAERVEAVSALLYDDIVLSETRAPASDPELLAGKVIEAGLLDNLEELHELRARAEFAAQPISEKQVRKSLVNLFDGLRSLAEAKKILPHLLPLLEPPQLERTAPSRLRLKAGRTVKVHYEPGKPPWVASRLQDFFGMADTPRIANGQVPLTILLLAPNQRPVQTTTDLAGFWQRLYPQLRRELGRRYPRHKWPENPLEIQ